MTNTERNIILKRSDIASDGGPPSLLSALRRERLAPPTIEGGSKPLIQTAITQEICEPSSLLATQPLFCSKNRSISLLMV